MCLELSLFLFLFCNKKEKNETNPIRPVTYFDIYLNWFLQFPIYFLTIFDSKWRSS